MYKTALTTKLINKVLKASDNTIKKHEIASKFYFNLAKTSLPHKLSIKAFDKADKHLTAASDKVRQQVRVMNKKAETIIQKADQKYAIAKGYERNGHPRKAKEYKDKASLLYSQSGKYGYPKYENGVKKEAAKRKKGVNPALAGLIAGGASATVVAPIDLLKTQIKAGKVPSNIFKATKGVFNQNLSDINKSDKEIIRKSFTNINKYNKPKQFFSRQLIKIPKPIRAVGKFWKGNPTTILKMAPAVGVQLAVFKALSNK